MQSKKVVMVCKEIVIIAFQQEDQGKNRYKNTKKKNDIKTQP